MQVLGSIYQIANDSKEARAGLKIVLTSSLTFQSNNLMQRELVLKDLFLL